MLIFSYQAFKLGPGYSVLLSVVGGTTHINRFNPECRMLYDSSFLRSVGTGLWPGIPHFAIAWRLPLASCIWDLISKRGALWIMHAS